jgi:hypothetical protein
MTGFSQIYDYSGPVSGDVSVELTPGGFGEGGFIAYPQTLNETLTFNPVACTLCVAGTITFSHASGSFQISQSGTAPNPETGFGSAAIGQAGVVSFDYTSSFGGPYPRSATGYPEIFSENLLIPVSGSGVYNGQAFSGNWDIVLPLITTITYSSATSITMSEARSPVDGAPIGTQGPGLGLLDGNSDGTYEFNWGVGTTTVPVATPQVVPEPNCELLFCIGALGLVFYLRRCPIKA